MRKLLEIVSGTHDKRQIIEEPCNGKLLRTVLKTSGTGNSLAEFNINNRSYRKCCLDSSDREPCRSRSVTYTVQANITRFTEFFKMSN